MRNKFYFNCENQYLTNFVNMGGRTRSEVDNPGFEKYGV